MNQESTVDTGVLTGLSQVIEEFFDQINQYVDLFIASVFMIIVGIFAIYLIHKIASKYLFPHFHKGRLVKITGVTVYALILLATALIVLSSVGADVTGIGQMALVTIFVIAVLSFLIMPFLPKLPFKIGHLIEVGGELGTVIMISPLYTTLKTLDATLVFVPNVAIMSMTIKNYSHESSRRIEINLSVENGVNLKRAKEALVRLMTEDERVLRESLSPAVFVMSANSEYVDLLGVCWVMNSDWFTTQSDMWEKIVNNVDEDVRLARPRLNVKNTEHVGNS